MWRSVPKTAHIERRRVVLAAACWLGLASPTFAAEALRDPQGRFTYRGEASQEEALRGIATAAGLRVSVAGKLDPTPRAWWLSAMRFDAALAAVLGNCNWAMVNSPTRAELFIHVSGSCRAAPQDGAAMAALDAAPPPPRANAHVAPVAAGKAAVGPGSSIDALTSAIDSGSFDVREQVVQALGLQRSSEAMQLLGQLALGDQDPRIRAAALRALGMYSDDFARGLIAQARSDRDPQVAGLARQLAAAGR